MVQKTGGWVLSSARMTVQPLLIGFRDLAGQANAAMSAMDFRFFIPMNAARYSTSGYNVNTERLDQVTTTCWHLKAGIASPDRKLPRGDAPQSQLAAPGATGHQGEREAGIALLERHHVRVSHADPVYQKTTSGPFSRIAVTPRWRRRCIMGRRSKCPGASSESGYFAFDVNLNYQYQAFGVPEAGLQTRAAKRSGYRALCVDPGALAAATGRAEEHGTPGKSLNMLGRFGFYEAIDYDQNASGSWPGARHRSILYGTPPGHDPAGRL